MFAIVVRDIEGLIASILIIVLLMGQILVKMMRSVFRRIMRGDIDAFVIRGLRGLTV